MRKAQLASSGTLRESSAWVGDVVEGQLALSDVIAARKSGGNATAGKASMLGNVVSKLLGLLSLPAARVLEEGADGTSIVLSGDTSDLLPIVVPAVWVDTVEETDGC